MSVDADAQAEENLMAIALRMKEEPPRIEYIKPVTEFVLSEREQRRRVIGGIDDKLHELTLGQRALREDVSELKVGQAALRVEMNERFAAMDDKFAAMDDKFAAMDDKFEKRMAAMGDRMTAQFEEFAGRILNGVKAQLEMAGVKRSDGERGDYQG